VGQLANRRGVTPPPPAYPWPNQRRRPLHLRLRHERGGGGGWGGGGGTALYLRSRSRCCRYRPGAARSSVRSHRVTDLEVFGAVGFRRHFVARQHAVGRSGRRPCLPTASNENLVWIRRRNAFRPQDRWAPGWSENPTINSNGIWHFSHSEHQVLYAPGGRPKGTSSRSACLCDIIGGRSRRRKNAVVGLICRARRKYRRTRPNALQLLVNQLAATTMQGLAATEPTGIDVVVVRIQFL